MLFFFAHRVSCLADFAMDCSRCWCCCSSLCAHASIGVSRILWDVPYPRPLRNPQESTTWSDRRLDLRACANWVRLHQSVALNCSPPCNIAGTRDWLRDIPSRSSRFVPLSRYRFLQSTAARNCRSCCCLHLALGIHLAVIWRFLLLLFFRSRPSMIHALPALLKLVKVFHLNCLSRTL